MKETPSTITTDDLHAYADGKLPPSRIAEVEAYLQRHPDAAAEIADYRAINAALRGAFEAAMDEAVPSAQVAAVLNRRPRLALPAAAALAGMMLGAGITWFALSGGVPGPVALDDLAQRSAAAFMVYAPEQRHPVEVAGSDSVHLAAWLSNRMGMSFRVPSLDGLGFDLVGGRLMVGNNAPAALLMYENTEGRRLVLYVRNDLQEGDNQEMRYENERGTGVVTWVSGDAGYGLAGVFAEQELLPAAHLVRAQLSL